MTDRIANNGGDFRPNKYQQALFDFITADHGSALVEAVAGSGKTTTIVRALELIPSNKSVLFLAFNKSIADELRQRVPSYVRTATFHSQGFGAWQRYIGHKVRVDADKIRDCFYEVIKLEDADDDWSELYLTFVKKMVSLAKSAGIGCILTNSIESWRELAEHHDIGLGSDRADEKTAIYLSQQVLQLSIQQASTVIDFDDMLYMPLLKQVRFYTNDWVFIDEAQDVNKVQLTLLSSMLCKNGRLVAVGDSRQAIYGFRGADATAMELIVERFSCKKFPLSVCYRCSSEVVHEARKIVPQIESSASALKGSVTRTDVLMIDQLEAGDAVLCRLTKPLIDVALQMIRQRKRCMILGRDLGKGLVLLVDKMRATDLEHLEQKLQDYLFKQRSKLEEQEKEAQAQALQDRVDSLLAIIDSLTEEEYSIQALKSQIWSLFSDSDNYENIITLCTVHKSKGLEWPRVYILGRNEYMPSSWAKKEWQQVQETNLIYVAITRAMVDLVYAGINYQNN